MKNYSGKYLHLVSIDIPSPPDYGGVIDIYWKMVYLKQLGVKIVLHCFQYGREKDSHLLELCEQVYYYPKYSSWASFSSKYPYVVYSRRNKALLANLLNIDAPILFDGLHTSFYLQHSELSTRRKIVRNHNIESEYFSMLGQRTSNLVRKFVYKREGSLLRKLEQNLSAAFGFVSVTTKDAAYFEHLYPNAKHIVVPCFSDYAAGHLNVVENGNYILYHGNLSHPENIEAALYIIKEIAPNVNYPFVFAGKNPPAFLLDSVAQNEQIRIVPNPDKVQMQALVAQAQINLLLSFQASGLKLKLLYALAYGKHLVANDAILHGTDFVPLVHVANTKEQIVSELTRLIKTDFTAQLVAERENFMEQNYNQLKYAYEICNLLFD